MRFALPIIGLALCLMAAGNEQWIVCHNGHEIEIAEPAVLQAHLDHGDCVGPCVDCEGRCCLGGGESEILTQSDCEAIDGRFQWNREAPCFVGGD